jgi:hypothetical protein
MSRLSRAASGAVLAAVCLAASQASAGEVKLAIKDGRVTLVARDVPLRQVLAEWERVGGTRIVNREQAANSLVSLELVNVAETRALDTLLRPLAGYITSARHDGSTGASAFGRIILMRGTAVTSPVAASTPAPPPPPTLAGPTGRPGMQRRVMPDGRVVTFFENPTRPGEAALVDDDSDPPDMPASPQGQQPGVMRGAFGGPGRMGGGRGQAQDSQGDDGPTGASSTPTMSAVPIAPGTTTSAPGLVTPAVIPGARPVTGATPPKPPGQ